MWKRVAPLIADTGRYEVFAPTMAGHNGGARGNLLLDTATLADDVERRLDALGWGTAHIVGKFLAGAPLFLVCRLLGTRAAKFPFARQLAYPAVSATADGLTREDIVDIIDDVAHCPAYFQMLVKSLTLPGLLELAKTRTPTHLMICEKDRVLPTPRYTRQFTEHLPKNTLVTTLDGVGHIPMYEAPQRIADAITGFVDEHVGDKRATG